MCQTAQRERGGNRGCRESKASKDQAMGEGMNHRIASKGPATSIRGEWVHSWEEERGCTIKAQERKNLTLPGKEVESGSLKFRKVPATVRTWGKEEEIKAQGIITVVSLA